MFVPSHDMFGLILFTSPIIHSHKVVNRFSLKVHLEVTVYLIGNVHPKLISLDISQLHVFPSGDVLKEEFLLICLGEKKLTWNE